MINTILLSKFLENENVPPFILGSIFNRYLFSDDNKYIYTVIYYKESKKLSDKINNNFDKYLNDYISILNSNSGNYKWTIANSVTKDLHFGPASAYFILENDLNITLNSFFNKLYAKLINIDLIHTDEINEFKKDFIRGFFEPRGSIDIVRNYLTQDFFYNNDFELKKANLLYEFFNIPANILNLNFRELQEQYVTGENQRNAQLRIGLNWYLHNIGMINIYKNILITQEFKYSNKKTIANVTYYINECKETNESRISSYEERMKYYAEKIYNKELSDSDIDLVRQEIGLDEQEKSTIRDTSLTAVFRDNTKDECICCKQKYKIEDRSFINKKTNRYYFEIHHIISLGGNKELDDVSNLSKLCPTCHAALKKGRALENYQKELIKSIYENSSDALEFAKHYFDTNDFNEIIDLTYKNLK